MNYSLSRSLSEDVRKRCTSLRDARTVRINWLLCTLPAFTRSTAGLMVQSTERMRADPLSHCQVDS